MNSKNEEIKLTYSCVLAKEKNKVVQVRFERGKDFAEGIIPEGVIERHSGFTNEEVEQLELYLRQNRKDIIEKAKQITGITHWF